MPRTAAPIEETAARLQPARTDDGKRKSASPRVAETILTVVLVLYPAVGTVGAIAAGLLFAGTGA